jgi:hypothetical protein
MHQQPSEFIHTYIHTYIYNHTHIHTHIHANSMCSAIGHTAQGDSVCANTSLSSSSSSFMSTPKMSSPTRTIQIDSDSVMPQRPDAQKRQIPDVPAFDHNTGKRPNNNKNNTCPDSESELCGGIRPSARKPTPHKKALKKSYAYEEEEEEDATTASIHQPTNYQRVRALDGYADGEEDAKSSTSAFLRKEKNSFRDGGIYGGYNEGKGGAVSRLPPLSLCSLPPVLREGEGAVQVCICIYVYVLMCLCECMCAYVCARVLCLCWEGPVQVCICVCLCLCLCVCVYVCMCEDMCARVCVVFVLGRPRAGVPMCVCACVSVCLCVCVCVCVNTGFVVFMNEPHIGKHISIHTRG